MATSAQSSLTEDWQTMRQVLACNRYMLENEIETDVVFSIDDGNNPKTEIKAHKYMLISRSPVFFAMLCGPLAETSKVIKVTDISPEVFKQVLCYIYYEEVSITLDISLPLIYAAKKYILPSLVTSCIEYLEDTLSTDNVCSILEQSILFDEENLKQKCLRMIQNRTSHVFDASSFVKISLETLDTILESTSLATTELEVFLACQRWAEQHCVDMEKEPSPENKREVLGETLYKIHVPSIPLKDFSNYVTPTRMLSVHESLDVFQYLTADEDHKPSDMMFPTIPRSPAKIQGPLKCHFRFDSKLDGLYKKHSIVMINIDHQVTHVELGLSFLPQTAGCMGRIVIGQDNNTVTLPYDSQMDRISCNINLYPGQFIIENYVTQMRFRVGLPKFAMLLTRVECCDGINLNVAASDAFSVLPSWISVTVADD